MHKMSIADAAEYFGISKEAIHNRIRRGSLESIVEDSLKYVLVDKSQEVVSRRSSSQKEHLLSDDRYYRLLEEQNSKLQEKVEFLESETRKLRDQKEQMLLDERLMLERIYREKDEQLKNILNSFKTELMLPTTQKEAHLEAEIEEVTLEAEIPPKKERADRIISLKKYLNQQDFSKKRREKIKKKIKKEAKKDKRIIVIGKKIYLNIAKYDYKDLVEK